MGKSTPLTLIIKGQDDIHKKLFKKLSIKYKGIFPVVRINITDTDRFLVNIDVENRRDPLSPPIPLSDLFALNNTIFSQPSHIVRRNVSRQIEMAGKRIIPVLKEILNSEGMKSYTIKFDEVVEMLNFLTSARNVMDILGIKIAFPKELKKLAHPRIAIRAKTKGTTDSISYLSLDSLLDFSWEIAIGDKTITKEEFLELTKSTEGIVKFRDTYLMLDPKEAQDILNKLNKPTPTLSSMDILRASLSGEIHEILFNPDEALRKVLNEITRVEEITPPVSLNATLRPYQKRGFGWLYSNTIKGFGSCIADDMGLGKTIQVITLILKLKEEGRLSAPVLVICPTTLVGNWQKECEKFAPSLKIKVYHGTDRRFSIDDEDVFITTYGLSRQDIEKFRERQWSIAVIDEAQNIKNPEVDQTEAVKSLSAMSYIAMSGTPIENRLSDLWSIFDFINRGYLGDLAKFKRDFAIPIERYGDRERIEKLRRVTSPFLLRRLKSDKDIINDLPEKVVIDEYCYLTKEQTALYQQVVNSTMKMIQESKDGDRKGLIFKLITALKQICNHPAHYSKKREPLKGLSGKAEKTIDLLEKIRNMGEKVLVFTQYKEMGEILVSIIKNELREDVFFFHGGVQRSNRDRIVEDFQTDPSKRIMILSLKAGGTGLNLTSASNVIHYDLWWNPAVETQATDRAHRIGQEMTVMVYRLITLSTFEEKIDEMIKSKKELADLTVSVEEQWITELSDERLKEIFTLSKD